MEGKKRLKEYFFEINCVEELREEEVGLKFGRKMRENKFVVLRFSKGKEATKMKILLSKLVELSVNFFEQEREEKEKVSIEKNLGILGFGIVPDSKEYVHYRKVFLFPPLAVEEKERRKQEERGRNRREVKVFREEEGFRELEGSRYFL